MVDELRCQNWAMFLWTGSIVLLAILLKKTQTNKKTLSSKQFVNEIREETFICKLRSTTKFFITEQYGLSKSQNHQHENITATLQRGLKLSVYKDYWH